MTRNSLERRIDILIVVLFVGMICTGALITHTCTPEKPYCNEAMAAGAEE